MKSKNVWKLSGLLLAVLILFGAVIWGIFTGVDRKELTQTLDKTTAVAKNRLQSYDDITANDRVKSLIRLLDKTKELSSNMNKFEQYGQQDIDGYTTEQRLSGAFAVDENLSVTLQSTQETDLDVQELWNLIIDKDYIREILEHPEETYTERIVADSNEYDLAVVPRQDTAGLVVAYAEKNSNTQGDVTLDSVFSDFPLSMNGVISVCRDNTVVSTNQPAVLGKTVKELQDYFNSSLEGNEEGLIRINPRNKTWYGHKDKMGEYVIYIFFPSSQVFVTRSIACGLYAAAAILIYLILLLVYSNMERATLRQSQKRMRIINAVAARRLLDRILHGHSRRCGPAAGSGFHHRLDDSLAHEGAGCIVDGHQLPAGRQNTVFGALGPGGTALHHLHRLCASLSLRFDVFPVLARHKDDLIHQRAFFKGADAPPQDGLPAQIKAELVEPHPGGGTCRHQNG